MKVVVDGAVDLPQPRPGVVSVPAKVLKDREPWSGELGQFWSALRSDPLGWTTTPPTTSELTAAYQGDEPVLALHVSGELSSTLDHAREAAAASESLVQVCDSRSLSVGAGLVVTRLGSLPLDLPAASKSAADLIARTHTYVLVDEVDFLLRSGRLGLLEGEHVKSRRHYLLAVKGHAIPLGHSRSREKAFGSLLEHLRQTAPDGIEAWALSHAAAADVEPLTALAGQAIGSEPDFVVLLDPTVGIHVGPDAVIVAALGQAPGPRWP
jgi:DegV family protein with EDD domain